MTSDQLSLGGLEDIVLPVPPPFWPPAAGVWILLIMLSVLAAALSYRWYLRRKENAYRRAGLVLLAEAESRREIDIVLKRVGLAVFPRETVAPLYGVEWAEFLDTTCSRCNFGSLLESAEQISLEPYRDVAATWIRHHAKADSC